MNTNDEAAFREFVTAQMDQLRGLAYLTCGDWQLAEDAVCTVLAKLYARWRRVDRPDSYARTMVVRAAVDEVRRPWWRRERTAGNTLPEPPVRDGTPAVVDRLTVLGALQELPIQQRAVLVLRYLEGRTVQETAEALRCPEGTVKTNTARGLARLRERLDVAEPLDTVAGRGHIERAS
ncbi:SigE family RNA polymerase sigma factor [Dactylosporangium salmoneum]|uniref:SigE family RNA polymerase sigma factor n=1 Tax=Dactylosporangium salmoneum TaxID=53361 RepID=A0ABP5TTU2_9ACTN